ncbi:hypothetical protein [Candidatus Regiella insecticola]|uniref:hypothetical protein n=1 Tax=Candidatus Regiella insecticola TaxID=138073 RepID=UPI001596E821|nr:hypothetical protein [Candidatus Regiella insecticola]
MGGGGFFEKRVGILHKIEKKRNAITWKGRGFLFSVRFPLSGIFGNEARALLNALCMLDLIF